MFQSGSTRLPIPFPNSVLVTEDHSTTRSRFRLPSPPNAQALLEKIQGNHTNPITDSGGALGMTCVRKGFCKPQPNSQHRPPTRDTGQSDIWCEHPLHDLSTWTKCMRIESIAHTSLNRFVRHTIAPTLTDPWRLVLSQILRSTMVPVAYYAARFCSVHT
jgi:hypothetical protein